MNPEDAVTLQKLLVAHDVLSCERKRYFALWHAPQGFSSYQIEALGIMTSARVRRIITLYKNGGLNALKERIQPGRASLLIPEAADDLHTVMAQNDRIWNTRTLSAYFREKYGVTLKHSDLSVQLYHLNNIWQRTRLVVADEVDPQEKQVFKENLDVVKKLARRAN